MNEKKLIVFEGIDNCGKSTISKIISDKLGFRYEKEPTFGSTEADNLNFNDMNSYQRELVFVLDRYDHQKILQENDIVLDRYFYSGIAYAHAFSPKSLEMVKQASRMHSIFKKPDLVILIDISLDDALKMNEMKKGTLEYNPKYTRDIASKLIEGYVETIWEIEEQNIPYIIANNKIGKLDESVNHILNNISTILGVNTNGHNRV